MRISNEEQIAIAKVIQYGGQFGYGNLISHLQTAWAKDLIQQYGMPEAAARESTASDGSGYPFEMQDDLVNFGSWDETGTRYRTAEEVQ